MDDWKASRIGCYSNTAKLFIVISSCASHEHSRRQFIAPSSSQIGVCNWLFSISKPLSTFIQSFEIALQIKIKGLVPWTDDLVSQVTTSSSRLLPLQPQKALQGLSCEKPPEWMAGSNLYLRPAATEAVYLTAPQEFSCVFMHHTHVTAIENTSFNPASWCQPAFPCKGIPLLLFQIAYGIRVHACIWRFEAHEGGLTRGIRCFLYLGTSFSFLLSNYKEGRIEGDGVVHLKQPN